MRRLRAFRHAAASAVLFATAFGTPRSVLCQSAWMTEHEPRRHALVLSASNYAHWAPLAAPSRDVIRMEEALTGLRFSVTRAVLSTAADYDRAVSAFRQQVQPGDLVVVYYSGHGFLAANQSYLAPEDLPSTLGRHQLRSAITLGEIEQSFDRLKPGFVLVIADACRVPFELADADSSEKKSPYPNAGTAGAVLNSIYAVASRDGTPARGASAADSLSPFTTGFAQYAATPGREFRQMFWDVKKFVLQRTDSTQQPFLFDFATSALYLNPDDSVQAQERREWTYLVRGGDPTEIAEYLARHPVNKHASAARAWLAAPQNRERTSPGSLVSPVAVDRAFEQAAGRFAIQRVHSGLMFDRAVDLTETENLAFWSAPRLGLVPSGTRIGSAVLNRADASINLLFAHSAAVTTQEFIARTGPSTDAARVARLPTGTRLEFAGPPQVTPEGLWLAMNVPEYALPVYVRAAPVDSAAPLELGSALLELSVGPVAVGVSDIVDEAPVRAAIAQLRREGKAITWVSIATGVASTSDSTAMMRARSRYAKYVLRDAGIGLTSITSVAQTPDVPPGTVRFRIFGYERPPTS